MTTIINPECIHYSVCMKHALLAEVHGYPFAPLACDMCVHHRTADDFIDVNSKYGAMAYLGLLKEHLLNPGKTAPFMYPMKLGTFRKIGRTLELLPLGRDTDSMAVLANPKE